jgi:hypothetical protein
MAKRYQRGNQKAYIEVYLLAIVSSVLLRFMHSDSPFGIFWPLYRLSYFDLCLLITPLLSFGQYIVCPKGRNQSRTDDTLAKI